MPSQEPGVKKQRAIPSHAFQVDESHETEGTMSVLALAIKNQGRGVSPGASTAAVFNVYDRHDVGPANNYTMDPPRRYTVAQGDKNVVSDTWDASNGGRGYDLHMHGPNGFVRIFTGDEKQALTASFEYDVSARAVKVTVENSGATQVTLIVVDNAYAAAITPKGGIIRVEAGGSGAATVSTARSANWYDVSVKLQSPGDRGNIHTNGRAWSRRYMGKMETGEDTTTDPAMGKGLPALGHEDEAVESKRVHPPMPRDIARLSHVKWSEEWGAHCESDRGMYKDACYDYGSDHDEL